MFFIKKPSCKKQPGFLGAEDEGFDYQKGVVPVQPGTSRYPPDIGILMSSNPYPLFFANKKRHPIGWRFCWQRMRDSNPRKRSQSPVCYRYTNPLSVNGSIICKILKKSTLFFKFFKIIFPTGTVFRPGHYPLNTGRSLPPPAPPAWSGCSEALPGSWGAFCPFPVPG